MLPPSLSLPRRLDLEPTAEIPASAWLVWGLATWLAGSCALGAESSAPAERELADASKSVFADDSNLGKDPFYPKSTRRKPTIAPTIKPAPTPDYSDVSLSLQGVSGTPQRRLALINNYTFAVGEEADLKIGKELVRVRCEVIQERSVVISFKGVTRELRLRDGL